MRAQAVLGSGGGEWAMVMGDGRWVMEDPFVRVLAKSPRNRQMLAL